MTVPSPDQVEAFISMVRQSSRVLVTSHVNPDGDAIGSALACRLLVESLGVPADVLLHHPVPEYLKFLPNTELVFNAVPNQTYDLAIVCDLNVFQRLGATVQPVFEGIPRHILIDHHEAGDIRANLAMVDTTAAATCVILQRLFDQIGVPNVAESATLMLAGVMTDTGGFRYPNTNAEALDAASRMVSRGANIAELAENIYAKNPIQTLKLQQLVIERLHLECNGKVATSYVGADDFIALGATDEMTEGLSSLLMSINTVQASALLRQEPGKKIRVSLRSRGDYDMTQVAGQFGGGGHRNASGCVLDGPMVEAEKAVRQALMACLES